MIGSTYLAGLLFSLSTYKNEDYKPEMFPFTLAVTTIYTLSTLCLLHFQIKNIEKQSKLEKIIS